MSERLDRMMTWSAALAAVCLMVSVCDPHPACASLSSDDPCFVVDGILSGTCADAILLGEAPPAHPFGVVDPELSNGFPCEPCPSCPFASRRPGAAFSMHVGGVLFRRPGEPMPWVAAQSVVAPMAHEHPVRDGGDDSGISPPRGLVTLGSVVAGEHPAVAPDTAFPRPALVITPNVHSGPPSLKSRRAFPWLGRATPTPSLMVESAHAAPMVRPCALSNRAFHLGGFR